MSSHSIFAPSKAPIWMNCHAALAAAKHLPAEVPNIDAARGSAKHRLAQECLDGGFEVADYAPEQMGQEGFVFDVDQDFIDQVASYVDAIRREPADEKFIEVRLATTPYLGIPDQGGTGDAVLLKYEAQTIEVHDAKFGFNRVMAEGNEQLLNYGAAALVRYELLADWKKVKVCIHQPSIDHYDEHTYTVDEVVDFAAIARQAAHAGYALYTKGTPEQIRGAMNPGPKQCEWCPIRGKCPARADAVLAMFPKADDAPTSKPAVELTDEQIAAALERADDIRAWCADIAAEAHKRAMNGRALPGLKVVRGKRSARFWSDPKGATIALQKLLGAKAFKQPELVSPTESEKLLRDKYDTRRGLRTCQNPGALHLVANDEKGEPVTVNAVDFKVVT